MSSCAKTLLISEFDEEEAGEGVYGGWRLILHLRHAYMLWRRFILLGRVLDSIIVLYYYFRLCSVKLC